MREDIKNLWVEALRSGVYEQGTGKLVSQFSGYDNDHVILKYCCLGVLCKITNTPMSSDNALLTVEAAKSFGMRSTFGCLNPKEEFDADFSSATKFSKASLVLLNDGGKSFHHIADVIEENWEVL